MKKATFISGMPTRKGRPVKVKIQVWSLGVPGRGRLVREGKPAEAATLSLKIIERRGFTGFGQDINFGPFLGGRWPKARGPNGDNDLDSDHGRVGRRTGSRPVWGG